MRRQRHKHRVLATRRAQPRGKQHKEEVCWAVLTQNSRGLPKDPRLLTKWFRHARARHHATQAAAVLLQETHCEHSDVRRLQHKHAATWGAAPSTAASLSYWSTGDRTAGVAILLNPHLDLVWNPALQDHWSPRFIAVSTLIDGVPVLLANVYAPNQASERDLFFQQLSTLDTSPYGLVLLGGDFNGILHPADRLASATGTMRDQEKGIRAVLDAWALTDALQPDLDDLRTAEAVRDYQLRTHTYRYALAGGGRGSSRLDRYYMSTARCDWVRGVRTVTPPASADHDGVMLSLANPDKRRFVRRPRRVYPPPEVASDDTFTYCSQQLAEFADREFASHTDLFAAWDAIKSTICATLPRIARGCRTKVRNGVRHRIRRLEATLHKMRDLPSTDGQQTELLLKRAAVAKDIARVHQKWRDRKATWAAGKRAACHGLGSAQSFRRVSPKYKPTIVTSVRATPGFPRRHDRDHANRMADGWAGVMQQVPTALDPTAAHAVVDENTGFLDKIQAVMPPAAAALLDAPFGTDEIHRALLKLPPGKAVGPDQLGNEWYRDHADALAPILTRLYNACWVAGDVPRSFRQATIFPLRKKGDSSNPLDYRPLSLLNSDYKVMARLLATRLRVGAPALLSEDQYAFAPGRTIHGALDIYTAAKAASAGSTATSPQGSLMLMVDFTKAYDSLRRDFLAAVLHKLGLPPRFRAWVAAVYTCTTCRFQVNGYHSTERTVTSGIRQGCPIAPLLFVLALEPLLRAIAAPDGPPGVVIVGDGVHVEKRGVAYADDTTLYLRDRAGLTLALDIFERFARASGLCINRSKSSLVSLGMEPPAETVDGIPCLSPAASIRYLGIQVASGCAQVANWDAVIRSLQVRLHLATQRSTTAAQRALIARSIIVPKITYVARHCFPSNDQRARLERLVRRFVWGATTALEPRGRRAPVAPLIAQLPWSVGGHGVPNIRLVLLTLAAVTILKWARSLQRRQQIVPAALIRPHIVHGRQTTTARAVIFPARTTTTSLRLGTDVWGTGVRIVQAAAAAVQLVDSQDRDLFLFRMATLAARPRGLNWTTGGYVLRVSIGQRDTTWSVAPSAWTVEWISALPCTRNELWREWPDHPAAPMDRLRRVLAAGHTIGDVVTIVWRSIGCVELRPRARVRLLQGSRRAIEELGMRLVAAYPALLRCPPLPHELRPFPRTAATAEFRWYLQHTATGAELCIYHWTGTAAARSQLLFSADDLPAAARRLAPEAGVVGFAPSPDTARVFFPYLRWFPHTPSSIKRFIVSTARRDGIRALRARLFQWDTPDDRSISEALVRVPWPFGARGFPALLPHEQNTWTRLRHHDFSCWREGNDRGCVFQCGGTTMDHPRHVFWDCATARALWMDIVRYWCHSPGPLAGWIDEIFSGTLREPRLDVWPLVRDHLLRRLPRAALDELDAAASKIYSVLNQLWRLHVTLAFQGLWAWRLRKIHDGCKLGVAFLCAQVHAAFRRRIPIHVAAVTLGTRDPKARWITALVTQALGAALTDGSLADRLPAPPPAVDCHVLLFDGGSRGNPGSGGFGAILLRIAPGVAPAVLWARAGFLPARSTTNNQAELQGLLAGLTQLAELRPAQTAIIGDSQLILNAMRHRRPLKHPGLERVYAKARALADRLRVTGWHHHLRHHNKTADALANTAMDARASTTWHPRTGQAPSTYDFPAAMHIEHDLAPWLEAHAHLLIFAQAGSTSGRQPEPA